MLQEGTNPERREFTVAVVFIMSKDTAPPEGELVGDILYVPVAEGYRNIVFKTKAMLCLVNTRLGCSLSLLCCLCMLLLLLLFQN